jgi:hypothetical protein
MNSPKIDLTPFCATRDDPRTYLQQPFSFDKFTAASNGHIMIVVNRQPGASDRINTGILRGIAVYIKGAYARRDHKSDLLCLDRYNPQTQPCAECEGHTIVIECPRCNGSSNKDDRYFHIDCETCDGSGALSIPAAAAMQAGDRKLKLSEPFRCPTCAGIGQQAIEKNLKIGDAHFQAKYLLLAKNLPGATVHAWDKADGALILFDAGFGLLMPIRVN